MKKKHLSIVAIVILAIIILLFACTERITKSRFVYKEPEVFEIFDAYIGVDPDYANFCREIWDNVLRYDKNIGDYSWRKGDYSVFVHTHFYIWGTYIELIFFTTTRRVGRWGQIYSTVTPFKFEYYPDYKADKIKTYTYINRYNPIDSLEEAQDRMITFLNEYIEKYEGDIYNKYLLEYMMNRVQDSIYIYEYTDYFCFYEPPSDFGGSIVLNKLTGELEFLGSSVWGGTGTRYFPVD